MSRISFSNLGRRRQSERTAREASQQIWAETYAAQNAQLFDQAKDIVSAIQSGGKPSLDPDRKVSHQITAARQRREGMTRRLDTDLAFLDLRERLAHNEDLRLLNEQYGAALEVAVRQIMADRVQTIVPPDDGTE